MKTFWQIFLAFFKIGALTFGGGYSMLPLIQKEVIEKNKWASKEEVMDAYAVAQILPGIIAVNVAVLLGCKVKKRFGGLCAAFGVVLPSLIVIMLTAAFLQNVMGFKLVQKAFWGIRVVVSALILQAIIGMWKTAMKDGFSYAIYFLALILALFTPLPTIAIIVFAVLAAVLRAGFAQKGDTP